MAKKKIPSGKTKKKVSIKLPKKKPTEEKGILDSYEYYAKDIPIAIKVEQSNEEFVPIYHVTIASISRNTEIILERIRRELIKQVSLGMVDILSPKEGSGVEKQFSGTIKELISKYFPDMDQRTTEFLTSYLMLRSIGLGYIEILLADDNLEEIAINNADEPIWVYHRKHGWLKTTLTIADEEQIKYYIAAMGRKVGRQISLLEPLMDAHLEGGERVNATISPISTKGNTITLRKIAAKPWTITDFIRTDVLTPDAAALIWLAIQFELSILFTGGTATGKTSMLNVAAAFFPPNQRIISIEDTRELQLPKYLHWVPMLTRLPNPEGKGGVAMLDLLVNSLRMRPDRVAVGEIRRKREAETLFEAIHTGHSVYATVHANDTRETITRLTSPPIEIPKSMLPAVSLIVVMYRNRRSGIRKIFQISEILDNAETNVMMQLDVKSGKLRQINKSKVMINTLKTFTGFSEKELKKSLQEKAQILQWLVKKDINHVDEVGKVFAKYYTDKKKLFEIMRTKKGLNEL